MVAEVCKYQGTAMVVARCVEEGGGATKCSGRQFAELSGINHQTISKYLVVWDLMVSEGVVKSRDDMTPGEDVDIPEVNEWVRANA